MKILVKNVDAFNAELFIRKDGERFKILDPIVKIECFEERDNVSVLGNRSCLVKRSFFNIVLCEGDFKDFDLKADYEIVCDVLRHDGIFKRLYFDRIYPVEFVDDSVVRFSVDGAIDFS